MFDVSIGVYLMTIVDWYSRQILSWRPSNTWITLLFAGSGWTLSGYSCPGIFNTRSRSQSTSETCTRKLKANNIHITSTHLTRRPGSHSHSLTPRKYQFECLHSRGELIWLLSIGAREPRWHVLPSQAIYSARKNSLGETGSFRNFPLPIANYEFYRNTQSSDFEVAASGK